MIVRFLRPAKNEMAETAIYYETQAESLGVNFLDLIEAAVANISRQPKAWPEIDNGIRKHVLRRYPFSILYRIDKEEIIIVAVMHHKQRPRYWIDRL